MFKNLFTSLFIIGTLLVTAIVSKQVQALDDFDLMYYGPDVTLDIGRTEFIVKFKFYDDADSLNFEWASLTGTTYVPGQPGVRAFATSHPENDVCVIHIIPASIWDDRESMTIMGHEVYHCALADHVIPDEIS
jgi:hypothetical protein